MQKEVLNIEYHKKVLLVKALNKHKFYKPAGAALGISERQVIRWKQHWGVVKQQGEYIIPNITT